MRHWSSTASNSFDAPNQFSQVTPFDPFTLSQALLIRAPAVRQVTKDTGRGTSHYNTARHNHARSQDTLLEYFDTVSYDTTITDDAASIKMDMTANTSCADDCPRADEDVFANLHWVIDDLAFYIPVGRVNDGARGDHGVATDGDGGPRSLLAFSGIRSGLDQITAETGVGLHDYTTGERDMRSAFNLGFSRDLIASVLSKLSVGLLRIVRRLNLNDIQSRYILPCVAASGLFLRTW